jgi:hypothetical protein
MFSERNLAAAESNWDSFSMDAFYGYDCEGECYERALAKDPNLSEEEVECDCEEWNEANNFVEPEIYDDSY